MTENSSATPSIWFATADVPLRTPLTGNAEADVCIVGGGIAGLTTAYLLSRAGQSVIVVDDGGLGNGETGRTTAHLVNALDDRFFELEHLHGAEGARLAAESHTRAIDTIEQIVREEQIDCGFERVDGYLFVQEGEDASDLDRELSATHRAGLTGVERLLRAPLPNFDTGPCLRFPRQAQFHPLQYLNGLVKAIEARGGRIHTGTHVVKFEDGPPASVETNDGKKIVARAIVVATNTPVNDRVTIHTKQGAYRSYVVALRVKRGSVPRALYWDTGNPYHYVRLATGADLEDVLIVGGEDHKTGQADDTEARFARLISWTRARFPGTGELVYHWSGQIMEPIDSMAFIGRNPGDKHVFIATGDSGNGMTHGTIAGLLLTDLITGKENPWTSVYDPGRITLRAAKEFAKENLNVAAQFRDLVTPGEFDSEAAIAPGSGAVMRDGLKKIAVYRDEQGTLHRHSAICPHLGCVVNWNDTEKTWDCPCHGSRFDTQGKVINGPAVTGLPFAQAQ